jgi:hypothetical protein
MINIIHYNIKQVSNWKNGCCGNASLLFLSIFITTIKHKATATKMLFIILHSIIPYFTIKFDRIRVTGTIHIHDIVKIHHSRP